MPFNPSRGSTDLLRNAVAPARARFVEPMLCRASREPPEGADWQYEVKLDGYRAIGVKTGGRGQIWSRNHKDFTRRFVAVARALAALPDETVVDGEIVALDDEGLPAFNRLQDFETGQDAAIFYTFDLPMIGGLDLERQALETRRGCSARSSRNCPM